MSVAQNWLAVPPTPTATTQMDHTNAEVEAFSVNIVMLHVLGLIRVCSKPCVSLLCPTQAVTRHVWAVWAVDQPAVKSVPVDTSSKEPSA